MSGGVFMLVAARDLRLAGRRRFEALLPVVFFIVAASLFPLGVGPEPQVLRQIAPGVVWVCALLAAMLSLQRMFATDCERAPGRITGADAAVAAFDHHGCRG